MEIEIFLSIIFIVSLLFFLFLPPYVILYILKGKKLELSTFVHSKNFQNHHYQLLSQLTFFKQKKYSDIFIFSNTSFELGEAEFIWLRGKFFLLIPNNLPSSFLARFKNNFFLFKLNFFEILWAKFHTLFLMGYLLVGVLFLKLSNSKSEIRQNVVFFILFPFFNVFFFMKTKTIKLFMKKIMREDLYHEWLLHYKNKSPFFKYWFYQYFQARKIG